MFYTDDVDSAEAVRMEYRSLTKVVAEMLIVESMSAKQEEDLAYFNRKVIEARARVRRLNNGKIPK